MFNYLTAETLRQAALYNLYDGAEMPVRYYRDGCYWTMHMALLSDDGPTDAEREAIRLLNTVGKNYSTYRQTDKFMLLLFLAEFVASENELEHEHMAYKLREDIRAKFAKNMETLTVQSNANVIGPRES